MIPDPDTLPGRAPTPGPALAEAIMTEALACWCRDRMRRGQACAALLDQLTDAGLALLHHAEDTMILAIGGIIALGTRSDDVLANWCEAVEGQRDD